MTTYGALPRNGEVIVTARDGLRQIRRVGGILGEYARLAGFADAERVAALRDLLREYRKKLNLFTAPRDIDFPAEYVTYTLHVAKHCMTLTTYIYICIHILYLHTHTHVYD